MTPQRTLGQSPAGTVPGAVPLRNSLGLSPQGTVPLRKSQRGYLLVIVVVMLFLVASIAMLLNYDSSIGANTTTGELESARADYVAQAGMQSALWRSANNACMGDVTVPATTLGADSYSATVTGAAAGTLYTLNVDQDAWISSDDVTNNTGSASSNHVQFESGVIEQTLTRFDLSPLPANAKINSAIAWFHLKSLQAHPEGPITVHEVTGNWDETSVTWGTFGGAYNSAVFGMIPAQDTGDVWVAINLTGLVQSWVNGLPNYGILFDSKAEGLHTQYAAREDATNPPRLEVVVGSGQASPVTIQATGTLDNGNTRTLTRPAIQALQLPAIHTFSPGPAESDDAEIWDQAPNNNYGDAKETWVSSASGDTTRSLLRFNMGAIPAGVRILEASLSLERQSGSGSDQPVSAHRIMNPWSEDSVTWNSRESGTNWDTAGGDFDNMAVVTTPVGPANQRYEWNITPLVQGWVDGSYPNYGVVLAAAIDGMPGERFYTSDESNLDRRPGLSVTYACECGSACLAPQGSGKVLMPVTSTSNPTPGELFRIAMLESWGYVVDTTWEKNSQSNFNSNIAANDVVYVPATVDPANIGSKLTDAPIGVVSEHAGLNNEFGIATGGASPVGDALDVVDTSHYITRVFPAGSLSFKTADTTLTTTAGTKSADAQVLATAGGQDALVALESGGISTKGGTVTARRVLVPVGDSDVSWGYLTNNGHLIVQRSLAWAMNAENTITSNLLMVVVNPSSLTSQEQAKKTLIESWGYAVNLIDESDTQGNFDTAFAANDIVFVTEDVTASNISTKLSNATIGVVTEEANLSDELGLSAGIAWDSGTAIEINDNSHFITSPFATGLLTVFTSSESLAYVTGAQAAGLQKLASSASGYGVVTLEAGATMHTGLLAAGRRVMLPWGGNSMDVASLTADGLTIFERALEWGAGAGPNAMDPIAHWKVDDGAGPTAVDSMGNHDGTLVSTPAWIAGQIDGALDFDGVNDYVSAGTFDVAGSGLTMMAWFNAETIPTSDGRFISKASGPNDFDAWWQLSTTDSGSNRFLRMRIKAGGTTTTLADSSVNLTTGLWYFAVSTYDNATGAMKLYLDGVEVKSGTHSVGGPVDTGPTVPVAIGANGTAERFFDGILDDVRVYNRALSAAEIADLYADGIGGPVAHWKLDDGAGFIAIDSIGGNDGDLLNGPSWDAVGQIDGALRFPGNDDYVNVPHDDALSLTNMTISLWLKTPTLNNAYQTMVRKKQQANYQLTTWDDQIVFAFNDGTGMKLFQTTNANLTTNEWHHVVVTLDDTTGEINIHVDGNPNFSTTTPYHPLPNTEPLTIGGVPDSSTYWPGTLDDIRLYDRVLSATEISDLFTAGSGGGGGGGGPAPVYESFEEYRDADNGSSSISVAKPAGTGAGDLLVAVVVTNRNNENTLAADDPGWTLLTRDRQASSSTTGVWWKVAGGSEPASYGFSWDSANPGRSYSWIMRFSGNDPTNPINIWDKFGDGGSTTPPSPAVTTTVNDTLILRIGGFDDDDITVGDAGMAGHTTITMQESNSGTGTVSGGAAYVEQAASGNSGTANFTLTASEQSRTITIGIAPAP